ncbi:MAG TPA: helix-turn-helix domain-containing protein [Candidatus Dormibacteraeota bacterium]|nr:helix-turn-helix domain-containing protein [Candidatus Dormibacteraeota bacterium]
MGYAETQDEILRAQLRVQPVGRRLVGLPASPTMRAMPSAAAVPQTTVGVGEAVASGVPPPVPPPADQGADADLAAAIEAAHRLRYAPEVEQIVAAAGISVEQMRGRGKGRELIELRRIVAAYLRRRDCSLAEIGRVLNRDHKTVISLLKTPTKVAWSQEDAPS